MKPASQGSALGISVVRETGDVANALMNAFSYDERVLMERFVAGRELAVSVIGTADAWALPVVEAIPRDRDFYDFEARYTPGLTDFVAPARLPDAVAQEAAALALACYRALGCRGMSRVDMILDADDRLWVLEINADPGDDGHEPAAEGRRGGGPGLRRGGRADPRGGGPRRVTSVRLAR